MNVINCVWFFCVKGVKKTMKKPAKEKNQKNIPLPGLLRILVASILLIKYFYERRKNMKKYWKEIIHKEV
ncbi:MAG: hypothetical protein Q4F21_15395, partial [Lachnospiraceae bacterium]|nr:hypothetical protein [Lachnospiraceae bacterium]